MEKLEGNKLTDKIIKEIEEDLKCYPDWTIRISMPGLGSPSVYGTEVQKSICFDSYIERDYEISEKIKKKVEIIDKVMDRLALLNGKTKELIEYRYFQDYSPETVMKFIKLSRWGYYNVRDKALECFARAMGYIK
ncbi:hypothetical protein [Clostridium sp. CF012]|uniref:hypothetical protein n=1 Tax=Clostridium sp. CF012 TaxID=2843319 RepID=UPI001C0B0016|nr:hypothetical protein [Clostridium sp. CF012]MBU3146618.1 hypothetical protein [Clostridium sp. CF012]